MDEEYDPEQACFAWGSQGTSGFPLKRKSLSQISNVSLDDRIKQESWNVKTDETWTRKTINIDDIISNPPRKQDYKEFVDTPGSPDVRTPDATPKSQSTQARRLAEYRAKYKVKKSSSAQIPNSSDDPSPKPKQNEESPFGIRNCSPTDITLQKKLPDVLVSPAQQCRPSVSPFDGASPEFPAIPPPLQDRWLWQCRICNTKVASESLFQMHLANIHFREKIIKRIKPPYKCQACDYEPRQMPEKDKIEDLLKHYATDERVAVKFYEDYCNEMIMANSMTMPQTSDQISLKCKMCDFSHCDQISFKTHLTNIHFSQQLRTELPKEFPFYCPFFDCYKSHKTIEHLTLHYGVFHNIAMEIYTKYEADTNSISASISCQMCTEKFSNRDSLTKHIVSAHGGNKIMSLGPIKSVNSDLEANGKNDFKRQHSKESEDRHDKSSISSCSTSNTKIGLPDTPKQSKLQAVISPYKPEKEMAPPFAQHLKLTNQSRHPSARDKLFQVWQSNSLEGLEIKIKELEQRLKDTENENKIKLREKEREFEKWIRTKEDAMDEELQKRKEVEKNYEKVTKDFQAVKAQLEKKQLGYTNLEEILKEKEIQNQRSTGEKNAAERAFQSKQEEFDQITKKLENKERKLQLVSLEVSNKSKEIESLQSIIQEKEDLLVENKHETEGSQEVANKLLKDHEKELDAQKTKIHQLEEDVDQKQKRINDLYKQLNDKEAEMKKKIGNLQKENQKLNNQNQLNKSDHIESKVLEQKIEEYNNLIKIKDQEVNQVLTEQNALNNNCVKIEQYNERLKSILDERLEEINTLKEEKERIAEQNEEKLKAQKAVEKEKRELTKEVQRLKKTLSEWEPKLFTNAKLISGLEKERDELQLLLKEQKDGKLSHEDQLYWKDVEIKNGRKEIKLLNQKVIELEQELEKKLEMTKENEGDIQKANVSISELEKKVKNLKWDLENGDLKNKVDDLQEENTNQRNQIEHLSQCLTQKSNEISAYKSKIITQEDSIEELTKLNEEVKRKNELKDKELRDLKTKLAKSPEKSKISSILKTTQDELARKDSLLEEREKDITMLSMMNKVLTDMDLNLSDIKKEPSFTDEEEPTEIDTLLNLGSNIKNEVEDDPPFINSSSVSQLNPINLANNVLVLNDLNAFDILDNVKAEPEEESDSEIDPGTTTKQPIIAPWPSFVPLASHPALIKTKKKKKRKNNKESQSIAVKKAKRNVARQTSSTILDVPELFGDEEEEPSSKKGKKRSTRKASSTIPDVTEEYGEEDENNCAKCHSFEPPTEVLNADEGYIHLPWIGCDCGRWFHKCCTKLKSFSKNFKCKSVKMKCIHEESDSNKINNPAVSADAKHTRSSEPRQRSSGVAKLSKRSVRSRPTPASLSSTSASAEDINHWQDLPYST